MDLPRAAAVTLTLTAAALVPTMSAAALPATPQDGGAPRSRAAAPLVHAHRGASGYRPEHTYGSYELAVQMGADSIEPDLVMTADNVLVVRHEPEISGTTDVARHPEFASRKTTKTIDGESVTGWFTEDFTLAELRHLRAVERLPSVRQRNTVWDGVWGVPTFSEVLTWRAEFSRRYGRSIGVIPEIKHPTYWRSIGKDIEKALMDDIARHPGLNDAAAPLWVQSFEPTPLVRLRRELGLKARTVFLTLIKGAPYDLVSQGDRRTYADLTTEAGMRELARDIDGLAPEKAAVLRRDADGSLTGDRTGFVERAHAAGMTVTTWTFRAENEFLPKNHRLGSTPSDFGRIVEEMQAYVAAGVDAVFTDQPDIGARVRDAGATGGWGARVPKAGGVAQVS